MGLESASYPNQLVATNPTGSDPKSTADDHIRLLKSVIQTTFPSLTGAMTAAQADLNKVGVTQPQTSNDTSVSSTAFVQTAVASAITAIGAGASMWVSGTTYALGNVVWSPSNYQTYRRIIAGAGTTDPASDATNWVLVSGNVQTTATQTLTNKTLTSPVISTISNTGTVTLPTTTDTLVGRATTDTLTNKTLDAPVITGGASISGNVSVDGGVSATGAISGSTAGVRLPTASPVYFNAGFTTYIQEVSAGLLQFVAGGVAGATLDASGNLNMTAGGHIGRTAAASGIFFNTNSVLPSTGTGATDNTVSVGSASYRWTTIYATTGAINTSDARAKTKVRTLADAEIEAAIEHSKEIGIFQWLDAVAKKGEKARQHIGMTVQRSIEIMESHGLDPMSYAFICHDVWGDEFVEHPAIPAVEAKAAVLDDAGNEIEPAIEAVEGKAAWTEQTQFAGDRYAFRYDQLNLFIARGIEARLAALEARA